MKRTLIRAMARGPRLDVGPYRLLIARVPGAPGWGFGRVATTGRGPWHPSGGRLVIDHHGWSLVAAGWSASVLRRTRRVVERAERAPLA